MRQAILAWTTALVIGLAASGAFAAGAIAVDDEEGSKAADVGFGIGTGTSREEAGRDALKQCKKAGNAECKVVVRYDTCGAYAASKTVGGAGWGSNEADAKANALQACGAGCAIVVSDCQ